MRPLPSALTVLALGLPLPATSGDRPISSGRLAQQPERYYGDHVQVTGEIARVLDRRAFTLDEDRPFVHHDLLVLVPRPLARVAEGEDVIVSGYVRRLDAAELRRDYDWFDETVPPDALDDAEGRPVLIAQAVLRAREDERVEKRRSRLVVREEEDDAAPLAVGRQVLLSDARVQQVLGRTTFIVRDDDGRERVVRVDHHRLRPTEGERLDISGILRRVPTDIDTWDLESEGARRLAPTR